jgi:hypothetical protein
MAQEKISRERAGEIAIMALKQLLLERRLVIGQEMAKRAIEEVTELGVSKDEALLFGELIIGELVRDIFAKARRKSEEFVAPPTAPPASPGRSGRRRHGR